MIIVAGDGTNFFLPDTLADVTVAHVQDFSALYGYALSLMGVSIDAVTDPVRARLARTLQFADYLTQVFAYFSGASLEDVREKLEIGQIATALGETSLVIAVQGPHMPLNGYDTGPTPAAITIGADTYELNDPTDFTSTPATHADFLYTIKFAAYMLELAEGDWTNFHNLLSGYLRLPGEGLTPSLMVPGNARAMLFASNILMDAGAALADYFINAAPQVLIVLDSYTTQQLNPP